MSPPCYPAFPMNTGRHPSWISGHRMGLTEILG